MRPLVAHCHLGLGRLHRRVGDHAKAEPHLATAGAMYREMGMSFWLEKMETAPPPTREAPGAMSGEERETGAAAAGRRAASCAPGSCSA